MGFHPEPVPGSSVEPVLPDEEGEVEGLGQKCGHISTVSTDQAEVLRRLIEWLSESGEFTDAGRRVVLLASVLDLPGAPRTTRQLGRALGCSHAQAGRLRSKIRRETLGILANSHR